MESPCGRQGHPRGQVSGEEDKPGSLPHLPRARGGLDRSLEGSCSE